MAAALASPAPAVDDHERIERIKVLDGLVAAAAAARAVEVTEFAESQQALQRASLRTDHGPDGWSRRRPVGVAEQVALARGVSPATGARQVAAARTLVRELPRTHRLLATGRISEWTATLVVSGSKGLDLRAHARLDAELESALVGLGARAVEAAVRRIAIRLDPASALRRSGLARRDRRVWTRPAPDTMAVLSGCVPVEQGIAAYAALDRQARSLRNAGDDRCLDQIRADLFVERLTGQVTADAVSFEVGVTMTADALLDDDDEPADMDGHGPVPAMLARDLLAAAAQHAETPRPGRPSTGRDGAGDRVRVFLRRLFTDPIDHTVTNIDTGRRLFDGDLARFLHYRDRICRTPGCEAPIRHRDHVRPHRSGGPTSAANGQGLCEACSYTKEAPGWSHHLVPEPAPDGGRRQVIVITTPTGHTYVSSPPSAPRSGAGWPHHREAPAVVRPRDRARGALSYPRCHPTSVVEHAVARLLEQAQPP